MAFDQLSSKDKQWLSRFVEGINYFQGNTAAKPKEMEFLALEFEPWSEVDALRVGRLASMDANWSSFFSFLPEIGKLGWETVWHEFLESGSRSVPSFASDNNRFFDGILKFTARAGSNSIVLGGSKTKNGSAVIASDPHLGIFVPNLWILMGYKSPSYHVIGYAFPAIPAITLGRNLDIAWVGTYMRGISSHLIKVDPKKDKISTRKDTIKIRFWPDQQIEIRETKKGPIISDALGLSQDQDIALSWVGHNPSNELGSYLGANRAKNWIQFKNAFSDYAVSGINLTYADRLGNIGMMLGIRQPILKDSTELTRLIKGADNGIVTFRTPDELPNLYNPKSNFIVSANNIPVNTIPKVAFVFGDNDRILRLNHLFSEKDQISIEQTMSYQQDVFSKSGLDLKNWLASSMTDFSIKFYDYWKTFINWDGYYRVESRGAVAFELLTWKLAEIIFAQKIEDDDLRKLFISSEDWRVFLKEELENMNVQMRQEFLKSAMAQTEETFSSYQSWGEMHVQLLQNPLGLVPVLGSRFRFGEFPAPGGANTVHKNRFSPGYDKREVIFGAQVRHISDMSNLYENYFVMLGGNDGWLTNPHLYDQTELWRRGEYLRLPLSLAGVYEEFNLKIHRIEAAGKKK